MRKNLLIDLEEFKEAETYWLDKLSGDLSNVKLLRDFPGTHQYEKGNMTLSLKDSLARKLLELSKNNDLSLYIILLSAFKVLIFKYTGQKDIIVASPIYTPSNEKYNKYVALRDMIDPILTFKEQVIGMKDTVVAGYKNEHYSIDYLGELLKLDASFSFSRFALLLESIHNKKLMIDDVENISNDLILCIGKDRGTLELDIIYNAGLFSKETIRRLMDTYAYVLEQVVEDMNIKIRDIRFMREEERKEVLFLFNDTRQDFPWDKTLQELFQQQVAKEPDNPAVGSTIETVNLYDNLKSEQVDIRLSYGDLNARSNQLAGQLREHGVRANTIVGMMVSHPLDMVVSIMGILKAGGAYLPLDYHSPEGAVTHILKDSNVQLLLVEETLMDKVPEPSLLPSVLTVMPLDDIEMAEYPESNPGVINCPADLAYVIYTSGTTGKPKGTLAVHRGVVNYTWWRIQSYECTKEDVALQLLSYCFDGFGSNFYTTLLSGGSLYVVPDAKKLEPGYIKEAIETHHITNVSLVPEMYRAILDSADAEELKSMRFVVLAGDKSSTHLIKESRSRAPHIRLFNEYGPTEATVTAAACLKIEESNTAIIGKPISNTRIYILDPSLEPVPLLVAGELCISGEGVTRGYLNQPELTAERFIAFHRSYRSYRSYISYRTGDLARWLPDPAARGAYIIEFLGRIDQQVKIMGHRIEPAEIETRLMEIETIKEAVVTEIQNQAEERYLCAYFVASQEVDTAELRNMLSRGLPAYMIPTYFMQVDRIPLTANGKVHRKALPLPDFGGEDAEYTAPADEVEEKLLDIWSDVLGMEKTAISTRANFFQVGGHSLKATTFVSKAHKVFNVEIPLVEVFNTPTIRELAAFIRASEESLFAFIEPVEEKEYYVLSSAQKRLYIVHQMELDSVAYNMPQVVNLGGPGEGIDEERLEGAFRQLIRRHDSFRTSFETIDEEPVQRIYRNVDSMDFKIEHFKAAAAAEAKEKIERFIRPFDLSRAPLLRVGLLETHEDQYLLMVDMHHIVADAVSHEILVRDFLALFEGSTLPRLRLQYKDYSEWQNSQKHQAVIRQQEQYWLTGFQGEIPTLNLPTDYERPAVQSFEGHFVGGDMDPEESKALKHLALEQGATVYMVLLAIFYILLAKLSRQEDIVIGTPTAGRRHADLEQVIGMMVNTLALRNLPQANKSFREFLDEVKDRTLRAFDNQEYQFEDLVEKLNVRRDSRHHPLFDVMFVFQAIEETGEVPEAREDEAEEAGDYGAEHQIARYDLLFKGVERGDTLFLGFEYGTKLFKEETIIRFLKYIRNIAAAVIKNPREKIKDIDIIPEEEKDKIYSEIQEVSEGIDVDFDI